MSGPSLGFEHRVRTTGEVAISRDGAVVTVLQGTAARKFLRDIEHRDPEQVIARVTGNYRRGNERAARRHHRNR